nr:CLAVATA3/ESR (CLE)-related protein 45 [Ipomoea trifida]GMD22842.1 CLAVATA3/ESR (CLE)-related protein 45 [Ipomoea batatas]GMD25792.1 CLAVATA3/ESR (CLE)-related protein 45 [Ipomoea batatas]GME08161.1 CLAVATA3/ESR (CLE)-related protein 45 [Ipomoea batatas]
MQIISTNKAFLLLFIYIGLLLAVHHVEEASAIRVLRSSDRQEDCLQMMFKSWHRNLLEEVNDQALMTGLKNTENKKQQEPANRTSFDPNRASERRVRKGSDPIHNKS